MTNSQVQKFSIRSPGLSGPDQQNKESVKILERQFREHRFFTALARVTQPLKRAPQIIFASCQLLGDYMRASRCVYAEFQDDQDYLHIINDYTKNVPSMSGRHRLSDYGDACGTALRNGHSFIVYDIESDSRIREDMKQTYSELQIRSLLCVPYMQEGRLIAALAVHQSKPRIWSTDEVDLMHRALALCHESIDRARLSEMLEETLHEAEIARDEARAANAAKIEFLRNVRHDIRNPMNAVMGVAQALAMSHPLTDKQKEYIDTLQTSAKVLLESLNEFLDAMTEKKS